MVFSFWSMTADAYDACQEPSAGPARSLRPGLPRAFGRTTWCRASSSTILRNRRPTCNTRDNDQVNLGGGVSTLEIPVATTGADGLLRPRIEARAAVRVPTRGYKLTSFPGNLCSNRRKLAA